MGQHARLSASQTKTWWECPGTVAMAESFPRDDPSGPAAQLGTCAHYLIEVCLGDGSPSSAYRGRVIEIVKPNTDEEDTVILPDGAEMPTDPGRVAFEVDDDMVEATTDMVGYVIDRLAVLFPDLYGPNTLPPDADSENWVTRDAVERGLLKLEGRVNPLPERDDTGGTADVTIDAWPDELELVDYKNGSGVLVPVEGNKQLRSYLLGRAVEVAEDLSGYEGYRYTICQPRHRYAPPGGVSSETITPVELAEFRTGLRDACDRVDLARAALDDGLSESAHRLTSDDALAALFHNGLVSVGDDGSHCTYCPHQARCPAARARVEQEVRMDFDLPPDDLSDTVGDVTSDNDAVGRILEWKPFIEGFLKAVEGHADAELRDGRKVPGRKLVRKTANRRWVEDLDEQDVEEFALEQGCSTKALWTDPVPPRLRTGPQIEKLLPKDARAEFSNRFMYKPDGDLVMVAESDGRPAVVVGDVGDDFDKVED